MKQTILRYGLLSGAVASALMMATTLLTHDSLDFENGMYYGYAGIFISMLFVFMGIKAYRDKYTTGAFTFGQGLTVGILIMLISCVCYVITWMIVQQTFMPDFMEKYSAYMLEKMRASGESAENIQAATLELEKYTEMYRNPLFVAGFTFLEPLPVAVPVTLISALILRRKG